MENKYIHPRKAATAFPQQTGGMPVDMTHDIHIFSKKVLSGEIDFDELACVAKGLPLVRTIDATSAYNHHQRFISGCATS
jgi:hypothetical protein